MFVYYSLNHLALKQTMSMDAQKEQREGVAGFLLSLHSEKVLVDNDVGTGERALTMKGKSYQLELKN